jgi:hypothetical protein
LRRNHVASVPFGRVPPRDGEVVDLFIDEVAESPHVVLVDIDARCRAKEPHEHRDR